MGGKNCLYSDDDLYYKISSCPSFETYKVRELDGVNVVLLPFFRYYQTKRLGERALSYSQWTGILMEYYNLFSQDLDKKPSYNKCLRYFTNYYSVFHPSRNYEVLFPYFPYQYNDIFGCAETIISYAKGIRIFLYDFSDIGVTSDDLNYYGFRLQFAARVFHMKTGLSPLSMSLFYPATGWMVHYTYKEEEKLEEYLTLSKPLRIYGSHCADCIIPGCKPLIDRTNQYGWRKNEKE